MHNFSRNHAPSTLWRQLSAPVLITDKQLDDSPAICVVKNQYCAFVYANKAMSHAFTAPTGGFFGKTDYHIMSDTDAAIIRAHDKSVLASGLPLETVEWVNDQKRTGFLVSKFRMIVRNRRFLGVIGVPLVFDVSEEAAITQAKHWLELNGPVIQARMTADLMILRCPGNNRQRCCFSIVPSLFGSKSLQRVTLIVRSP